MRKINILITLTAFLTTPLMATERNIIDLQFLPTEGTFYSESELGWARGDLDNDTTSNVIGFVQTFGYSFMDNAFLDLELGFTSTSTDPKVGNKSTDKGLSDLTVGYTHRIMDNAHADHNWDAFLRVTPKIGNKVVASGNKDGNAFSGQTSVVLGSEWGKKMGQNSFKVGANATWNSKLTHEDATTGNESDFKSSFDFGFNAAYQYDINTQHAVKAGLDLEFVGKRKTDTTPSFDAQDLGFVPEIELGYRFAMSETMKLGADMGYTWFSDDVSKDDTSAYGLVGNFTVIF